MHGENQVFAMKIIKWFFDDTVGLSSRVMDVEALSKQVIEGLLGLLPQGTTQPVFISSNSQFHWDQKPW